MTKLTAITLAAAISVTTAAAAECVKEDAESKLTTAMDAGIITGVGMVNDLPTVAVDAETWRLMELNTRMGMVETLECFIAGPGNIVTTIQATAPTGKVLATFSGIERHLDVSE